MTDPIFCAATYTFPDTQAAIDFVQQKLPREEYARYGNPSGFCQFVRTRSMKRFGHRIDFPAAWPYKMPTEIRGYSGV